MSPKKNCMSVINLDATVNTERHAGGRRHPTPDPIPTPLNIPGLARSRPKRTKLDRNGPKRTEMDRIGHGSADRKRGRRKGATSRSVKNCQKVSRQISTIFALFGKKRQKSSKTFCDTFRHFSTVLEQHRFSGLFGGL